jgi:hypothetical protein
MPTSSKSLKPNVAIRELGVSGTIVYQGQIESPDPNRDLVGHRAIETYDKMRLGDGTIKALLRAIMLPILSSTLRVDPASESAQDKEVAEFVERQLTGMTRTFEDTIREALLVLPYGHYVFEIVYRLDADGRIGLKKLAPRLPSTIRAWQTEDGQDGITQYTQSGQLVSIPIEKLVIFTNEKEGDNWQGISILRNAYKAWYMKENLEKIDAISHERHGVGIPYVKPSGNPQERDKQEAITTAKNMRASEEGFAYIPSGWEYGFFDMHLAAGRSPLESIQYHRFEILLSVLASFLTLGSTDSGSRALSSDLSEFFEMSLKFLANTVLAAPLNKFLVQRLVDLNFSVTDYPKIRFDGIGKVDFATITKSLVEMNTIGTFTPQLDVENYLRRAMGVPEAPEDAYYPEADKPRTPVAKTLPDDEPEDQEGSKEIKSSQAAFLDSYIKQEAEAIRQALGKPHHDA